MFWFSAVLFSKVEFVKVVFEGNVSFVKVVFKGKVSFITVKFATAYIGKIYDIFNFFRLKEIEISK